MGRGDRKTTRGKIAKRSYGNVRPHTEKTAMADGEVRAVARKAVSKTTTKSAPAKKAPLKAATKSSAPAKKAVTKAPAKSAAKKTAG